MQSKDVFKNLCGIGVEISGTKPNRKADIERTILEASALVDSGDRRILGLLASWILVHGALVWVGKLKRLLTDEKLGNQQVISALSFLALEHGFHEWKTLARKYPERALWDSDATRAAIDLKGAEPIFLRAGIMIPEGFLRIRSNDILPLEKLSKAHLQVRLRLIFGTNLRADAVFYLASGVSSPSELMRKIGCSYEPAHRVWKDLKAAGSLELPKFPTLPFSSPKARSKHTGLASSRT